MVETKYQTEKQLLKDCLLFPLCKRIRDCIIFQICTYIKLTKLWNRGLIWSVTNKTILHLAWFLVLPLVTEKIDLSLRLRCLIIKKMTKIFNVTWVSLHRRGVHFSGQNTAERDENNLSMASWFICEVCSL